MGLIHWAMADDGMYEVKGNLTLGDVQKLIKIKKADLLHIDKPLSKKAWQLIQDKLIAKRPDITIRLYGSAFGGQSLEFLDLIPSVQRLQIDHTLDAPDLGKLASLKELRMCHVDCRKIKNFGFLENLPEKLEGLTIGSTLSKKLDLQVLDRYKHLKMLYIEGHSKGVEVIRGLTKLEALTLRSVTAEDIDFLKDLKKLWKLDIKLGGTTNLRVLKKMAGITYLELWMIKGLEDVSFIAGMTGLRYLFLESLTRIETLPNLGKLKHLKRIDLETMKGITTLEGVAKAPALETFIHTGAKGMAPEGFVSILKKKSLKAFRAGTGKMSDYRKILELMEKYGVEEDEDESDRSELIRSCRR